MGLSRTREHPWLDRYTIFVAFCTFLLVVAGALVSSQAAAHILLAGFVGVLAAILALWIWVLDSRRWLRRLAGIAVLVVLAQAILGWRAALAGLSAPIAVAHAGLGQVFFSITVCLALLVRPSWNGHRPKLEDTSKPSARQLAVWTAGAVFLQVLLGAASRQGGMGITPHLLGAVVVAVLVAWLIKRILANYAHRASLVRTALLLGGLVVLQLLLGVGSYMEMLNYRSHPELVPPVASATTLHAIVGALVLAAAVVMVLQAYRGLSGRPAASPAELGITT